MRIVAVLFLGDRSSHLREAILPGVSASLVNLFKLVDVSVLGSGILIRTVTVDNHAVQATFARVLVLENGNAHQKMGRNILVHP